MKRPRELNRLGLVMREVTRECDTDLVGVIHELGFEILDDLKRWDYFCTPLNSLTVACTGGDGVHYGILQGGQAHGAVVLTAPTGEIHNTVVGKDLVDFLRLGYYRGFTWVEEFAYRPELAAQLYAQPSDNLSEIGTVLLRRMRSEFQLRPIRNVSAHYRRLQRYSQWLKLPEEQPEERGV